MWQAKAVEEKKPAVLVTASLFNSSFVVFTAHPICCQGGVSRRGLAFPYSHEINRDNYSKLSYSLVSS